MTKLSYNYIRNYIENEGYKLLSKEYINSNVKLKIRCPEGHEYEVSWANFQHGRRCPYCAGKAKNSYGYIKEQIEKEGYKLLSKKYKNCGSYLDVKCPQGHEYKVTWNNFQRGKRCPVCNGGVKLSYEYIKEKIKENNYKLLSKEYKNNFTRLKLKCPLGHIFEMTWNHFQKGVRCPICWANSFTSMAEKEIAEIIRKYVPINRNDRKQITNPLTGRALEFDIWIPSLNKAIEYNGTYWHSFRDAIRNDKIKLEECNKKDIRLLVIKEKDWIDNKEESREKIISFIKR